MSLPTRSATTDAAVELRGVEVRIDGNRILHGVDWTVDRGQRWVVLGANGSGKTTLMRVMSLALHPSAGEVRVLGGQLGHIDVRSQRRRIGVVSAAVANSLRPGIEARDVVMTARHAALEPWWHEYTDADRDRAHALLDRFGMGRLADHPFGTLSSGERQRALLARSLMAEPELLVLDEPTAGLDVMGREQLLADLEHLARAPDTPPMVLVTHHLEEIPPGFTHLLLLHSGSVLQAGPLTLVLTEHNLSRCFGLDLTVERFGDRWTARARQ